LSTRDRWGRARGFTLIELLVVLALIALATATVALAMRDSDRDLLEREAERLGTLLDAARLEARTQSLAVRWRAQGAEAGQHFRFEGLPSATAWPTQWLSEPPPTVRLEPVADAVSLGPDPLIPAQTLVLQRGEAELRLHTDGLGPFAIQRESAKAP